MPRHTGGVLQGRETDLHIGTLPTGGKRMSETYAQILKERYDLSIGRIGQIPEENLTVEPFRTYFNKMAGFLLQMDAVRR